MFLSKEHLIEQLNHYRLESVAEPILYSARPAALIARELIEDDAISIGASKMGGNPDLSPDFEWKYKGELPLTFVAQFRLSDLARSLPPLHELPTQLTLWDMGCIPSIRPDYKLTTIPQKGMLYLFYPFANDSTDSGWYLAYSASEEGLERRPHPEYSGDFGTCEPLYPHRMIFHQRLSIPTHYSMPSYLKSNFTHTQENHYWDMFMAHYERPWHHFYGYPFEWYRPVEEDCVRQIQLSKLSPDDARTVYNSEAQLKYVQSESAKWQFLFQLDTDHSVGIYLGRTVYVCIPRTIFEARQFDDCCIVMQSH